VDIDFTEFNKNVAVDLSLHGDLKEVLESLQPDLTDPGRGDWLAQLERSKAAFSAPHWPSEVPNGTLGPIEVLRELAAQAPGAVMVTDVGQHQMWQAQVWRHERPHTLITSGGLGTMGFALPAAIGAKFARPDADVWVVAGDGGIQMNSQELMTLVQEGLKVNIAVLNNGHLGMVRQWQSLFYEDRRSEIAITSPDFVLLAQAYGLTALRATTLAEAAAAIKAAQAAPGSVLIDFWVDPEASVYPIVPPGGALHEMLYDPEAPPVNPS
jgi:acetolactate synthase-1/2/3 large subunit